MIQNEQSSSGSEQPRWKRAGQRHPCCPALNGKGSSCHCQEWCLMHDPGRYLHWFQHVFFYFHFAQNYRELRTGFMASLFFKCTLMGKYEVPSRYQIISQNQVLDVPIYCLLHWEGSREVWSPLNLTMFSHGCLSSQQSLPQKLVLCYLVCDSWQL